jgi:general secretion pathway protein B
MSSILKALQKLEQEKVTRQETPVDIARDILAPHRLNRRRLIWLIGCSMAIIALLAVLATYALMGGFSPRPEPPVAVALPPLDPPVVILAKHATPARTIVKQQSQPPILAPAAPTFQTPQITPVTAPVVAQPPDTPPVESRESRPLVAPLPTPALAVTGIAYQQGSASRMAVVNGRSVMEGTIIEGARVEAILQDRVRFSFDRRSFDVPVEKGN